MPESTTTIGSGTVAGAIEYLDFLSTKGYVTAGATTALKTGFTRVMKVVGGSGWKAIDVRNLNIDDYMTRFANMTQGTYNSKSLIDYKSRVKKVVDWYLQFLAKPGWTPDIKARARAKGAKPDTPTAPEPPTQPEAMEPAAQLSSTMPTATQQTRSLVAHPFPLNDGTLATLYLPPSLRAHDAERMARFIETLVIEGAGGESDRVQKAQAE